MTLLSRILDGDTYAKINVITGEIESWLTAFPGANLVLASVPNTALAKGGARFEMAMLPSIPVPTAAAGLGGQAATVVSIGRTWIAPQIDGAAATFEINDWSFSSGNDGIPTSMVKVAGSQLLVKVNGVTQITVDLNAAGLVGLATTPTVPIGADGLAITVSSGQTVRVDYVSGGATARYPAPSFIVGVSLAHVNRP